MPMIQTINVINSGKDDKRVSVGVSFEFDKDDPRAEHIYRGLALFLKEAFTPEEAEEFLRKFNAKRKKLVAKPEPAKRKRGE
jgi:hypothetical protein